MPKFFAAAVCLVVLLSAVARADPAAPGHAFIAFGAETRMVDQRGQTIWKDPRNTRDGWVLPNGNILLALSKSKDYPGGGVVELTRAGETLFEWKGTQSEVNTVQALPNGRFLVAEAGPKPRLLEIARDGTIALEVPISCQTTNHHMQTRMARKLPNGNYLVPHLLDKVVREYDPTGKIVWGVATPNWAFTAIRLPNGNTLINCTYGNNSIEVDSQGKTVWELSNSNFSEPLIKDACGAQRLPNGNTVICAYGIGVNQTKLVEVTPEKKVVWTHSDSSPHGIHHVQILDAQGRPLPGVQMR